jgi:hypothetical protein
MEGGRDPSISAMDVPAFRDAVTARAAELNCITRGHALLVAFDLALRRRRVGAVRLEAAHMQCPPELLQVEPPSPEWLRAAAADLGLKNCSPQELDAARRCFCDHEAISTFFITFQSVIQGRDPQLGLNMDETQLSARKRFRVLTANGHLPLVKAEATLPHITGVCTVSAGGGFFTRSSF